MVRGFMMTLLVGFVGGLAAELIRVAGAFRANRPPTRNEYVASFVMVLLGGGAVLFGWDDSQPAIKVAVLGAAFPLIFSAAVGSFSRGAARGRSELGERDRWISDYLAGRY